MSRAPFISLLVSLVAVATYTPGVSAEDTARIVLLAVEGGSPQAPEVAEILGAHLERVGVWVDVVEVPSLPETEKEWSLAGSSATDQRPGTLAVFGWTCEDENSCLLHVLETTSFALATIKISPGVEEKSEIPAPMSLAIAAAARESVWGGLLQELNRLVAEGEHPTEPPPSSVRMPRAYDGDDATSGVAGPNRAWFWLEGGYQGEYPYPGRWSLHGPWIGVAISPGKNVVPAISAGWLGIREEEDERGIGRSHRFPILLEVRIAIPVGPAMFSIAPVGRVDIVLGESEPTGPEKGGSSVEPEISVGGLTRWHLPMPGGKLELVLGAGVLATVYGSVREIGGIDAVPGSDFKLIWSLGIAWSPL